MKLLLDTHALIWWILDSPRLTRRAYEAIAEAEVAFVSAVSAMEVCTKHRIGKLPEVALLAGDFEARIAVARLVELPLTARHAALAGNLDIAHKDPFDRLLIAQSLVENLALVSNEAVFDRFGVLRIW